MGLGQRQSLIEYLGNFLTAERRLKIDAVLSYRTRYVTLALEDIHTSQNAGAVLRNCDNFGIQDVHIMEQTTSFKVNLNVTRGCQKWLTIYRYASQRGNIQDCIKTLTAQGYRVVATTPHDGFSLSALPIDRPVAQ